MRLEFAGEVWHWRGPAPFHFVTVPAEHCPAIEAAAPAVSYGWGMIPAAVQIGATHFTTALWPKNGGYIIPLKNKVRAAEQIDLGDTVTLILSIES